jgi:glycosyltransferase involved in cell wall biosynthesis
VLAGDKDGSRDALLDGELGVLVNPDDPAELRDAIVAILLKAHPHPLIYQWTLFGRRSCEVRL